MENKMNRQLNEEKDLSLLADFDLQHRLLWISPSCFSIVFSRLNELSIFLYSSNEGRVIGCAYTFDDPYRNTWSLDTDVEIVCVSFTFAWEYVFENVFKWSIP